MNIKKREAVVADKTIFISCVVPVYNEEAVIAAFIPELLAMLQSLTRQFEIIIVDDGSTDATVQKIMMLAQTYPLKYLVLSRNFGKEIALTAGIEHATGELT